MTLNDAALFAELEDDPAAIDTLTAAWDDKWRRRQLPHIVRRLRNGRVETLGRCRPRSNGFDPRDCRCSIPQHVPTDSPWTILARQRATTSGRADAGTPAQGPRGRPHPAAPQPDPSRATLIPGPVTPTGGASSPSLPASPTSAVDPSSGAVAVVPTRRSRVASRTLNCSSPPHHSTASRSVKPSAPVRARSAAPARASHANTSATRSASAVTTLTANALRRRSFSALA